MIDYLVILLSTDWFGPFWSNIGVEVGEEVRTPLRLGCRDIVQQILSEEEHYYLVSFSDQRKTETRASLESLLQNSRAPKSVHEVVHRWTVLTDDELKAGWICNDFTTDVLSGSRRNGDPKLDPEIVARLASARKNYDIEPYEFSKICSTSPSTWDAYTRGLFQIVGANFGPTQDTSTVTFNGIAASASIWSGTTIKVQVPACATTGKLVFTVDGEPSNAVTFTVSNSAFFDRFPFSVTYSR